MDDGRMIRRTTAETPLRVTDEALSTLVSGSPLKIYWAHVDRKIGALNIVVKGPLTFVQLGVYKLNIKAPYALKDDVLVPMFESKTDPVMSIPFVPHKGMELIVGASTQFAAAAGYDTAIIYLYCRDERRQFWVPPLPNVHEDGSICNGNFAFSRKTSLWECALQALDCIENAQWNDHLRKPIEKTHAMFRFKAKNEGFDTVPVNDWTKHCTKVANEVTNLMV